MLNLWQYIAIGIMNNDVLFYKLCQVKDLIKSVFVVILFIQCHWIVNVMEVLFMPSRELV